MWTLVLQGVGAMAVFGAVVLLGSQLGPEAQGLFSRIKSELEFIAALSMFGMPQAVFFFLSSRRMNRPAALKMGALLALVCVAISSAYLVVSRSADALYWVLFALASAAVVVHGVLRVIVLASFTTRLFNLVTALPQVMILLLVFFVVVGGSLAPWMVAAIFLAAFCGGSAFAWAALRTTAEPAGEPAAGAASPRQLLAFGAATWVVAALSTATAVFWLRHTEAALGLAAVGVFSMGLTLVQLVLTPINYAAPLLFKRWMGSPDSSHAIRWTLLAGLGVLCLIAPVLEIQGFFPVPEALTAYSGLRELRWPFAFSAVAEAMMRIAAVAANAAGTPWAPVLSELVRIVVLSLAVGFGAASNLVSVATWWAAGAVLATIALLMAVRRMGAPRT